MKKTLYKYLALIIIVSLTLTAAAVGFWGINKKESTFKMAILSDLHIFAEAQVGNPQSEDYKSFDDNGRFLLFSEALLKSATDELIEGDSDVVIIPGDLTESGTKLSHLAVASQLKRLVATGKKVYVIPGNHDINNSSETFENGYEELTDNVTAEEFAEIYADFGYKDALERDAQTLSYTADLNDEYRLFGIDVSFYQTNASIGDYTYCRSGRNTAKLEESLMIWLEEQLEQCKTDNKTPIGMMHYPLLSHLGSLVDNMSEDNKVNDNIALADLLINGGMKYIFTGHLHAQNIAVYQNDNGKIYDVETGSLASYPSPVRYFTSYHDEEIITSAVLTKIDEKHLPSYISGDMRDAMLSNLQDFLSSYYDNAMTIAFMKNIDTDVILSILNMFGLDEEDAEVKSFSKELYDLVIGFLNMKLYDKFAEEGEQTLESIASLYNVSLPDSDYENVLQLVFDLLKANAAGDEYAPVGSVKNILFKYSLFSIFHILDSQNVFSKLNALDSSIADIDLSQTVQTLFTTGELEVVSNDLIQGIVSSLEMIKDSKLSRLTELSSAASIKLVNTLFGSSSTLDLGGLEIALSYQVSEYIDIFYEDKKLISGKIKLASIIDNELFGPLGENLINDEPPGDNFLRVKK